MIMLTRENGQTVLLNSDLIETVEESEKSVITLTTGNAVVVTERLSEIEQKVVEYRRKISST